MIFGGGDDPDMAPKGSPAFAGPSLLRAWFEALRRAQMGFSVELNWLTASAGESQTRNAR